MSKKGFTLVELLVVIVIIAILSSIGFVTYTRFLKDSRDGKRQSDLKTIQAGLEEYYADQFFYPTAIPTDGTSLKNTTGNNYPVSVTKTYMNSVPTDPQPSPQPQYRYEKQPATCDNNPSGSNIKCTGYCLYAEVENTSSAVNISCTDISGYNYEVTLP